MTRANEPYELKAHKSKIEKNHRFQRLTFENMHKGPFPRPQKLATNDQKWTTSPLHHFTTL